MKIFSNLPGTLRVLFRFLRLMTVILGVFWTLTLIYNTWIQKNLGHDTRLLVIAPATANIIAKLAHGIADDALTCIALALNPDARLVIAPAMNGKMWQHAATQQNVATLKSRGVEILGPDAGMLACGYEGLGRLLPVEKIAERVMQIARKS